MTYPTADMLLDWMERTRASVERGADGWYVEWRRHDGWLIGSTRATLRDAISRALALDVLGEGEEREP